ncbi:uncharacterized protein LOC143218358 [Lasioglossum baleicum]|uniref:uncharacterized protein LOC143218358 n=1 Tax=Lasioglossum baleicum TaxID=434251 RepID=UPI003FCE4F58
MVKNAIKVYARLRPEKNRKSVVNYTVHRRPKEDLDEDFLNLVSPTQKTKDYPDNRPESWNYSFFRVFEESATQEDVFENVARPVMDSALDGYNGTVFAYGQTASGKTHSIIGNQRTIDGRGIIPRSLQYLFNLIEMRPENLYTVEVAFLEIYNENGYDLLDRRQREYAVTRLEDLPRVTIQEDENGQLHLKNLSFHGVRSLEDAFELLLVGDSNRVTTETPMNPQSSRSHCIFTIVISMKEFGADHYKRAKVHLVDLAGSERVYKCSISGTILTEAKHINLSLHYLEQVIVCLGQESVTHIPYRNSYLTSILRDSLGGNCMTVMLANLSAVSSNLEETVSTCRFAQRVALINNDVKLVLQMNIQSENALLKLEIEKLKQQITAMTGQTRSEELTAEDKWKLDAQIRNFLDSDDKISWNYNTKSIEYCFDSFRRIIELSRDPKSCLKKLEYYKDLVFQRDKEISLLIDLLNKEKAKTENCLKEGLPDDGGLQLTKKSRTLDNHSEEFKLKPEINSSNFKQFQNKIFSKVDDGSLCKIKPPISTLILANWSEKILFSFPICLIGSKHKIRCPRTSDFNRVTLHSILAAAQFMDDTNNENPPTKHQIENTKMNVEDEINSTNRRNHKKRSKECNPTLESYANSQHNVANRVNDRTNFLAANIANVRRRKNSLEQTSTSKHGSVDNCQPEYFRCNVVNVTLDNSSTTLDNPEVQQPVRKSEKKQARNSEVKKSVAKNILSDVIMKEENGGSPRNKTIKESTDQSVPFYEKMLHFNVPRGEMKSCRMESVRSENILKSQISKSNSPTRDSDIRFRNTFQVDSKFAENFDTGEKSRTPKPGNDAGNYSVSARSRLQNGDQRVDVNSQIEPLRIASICNERKDMLPQSTRSNVCFSNRETESNKSKGNDRKSSVRSFTADRQEKFSARSKEDLKSDCASNNGSFENSLPLTGDPEIDEEIIAFYKAKRLGGVY